MSQLQLSMSLIKERLRLTDTVAKQFFLSLSRKKSIAIITSRIVQDMGVMEKTLPELGFNIPLVHIPIEESKNIYTKIINDKFSVFFFQKKCWDNIDLLCKSMFGSVIMMDS